MIAGCSFSATCQKPDGTSWSEQLSHMLGWDLINLARQGCSNGGVRLQIEEIRRQRPDFAIITPTFWDRMEIPARAARAVCEPLLRQHDIGAGYWRLSPARGYP